MDKKLKALAKKIVDVTHRAPKKETYSYDTQATVTRVEKDIAWVHIPGGIVETPVKLSIQASVNDKVMVRLANGDAWITGNISHPPTDDIAVEEADKKIEECLTIVEDFKERTYRFLNWISGQSTEEVSERVKITSAKRNEPGYKVNVKDGVGDVSLMVDDTGTNHGLWSDTLNKWLIHGDGSDVYLNDYKLDFDTNNTLNTLVPVFANGVLQHRVIPVNYNRVPNIGSVQGSGDEVTRSGTTNRTLCSFNYTTNTGKFIVFGRAVIKTSRNTSNAKILVDNTARGWHGTTNSTSFITVNPVCYMTDLTPGSSHTIALAIAAQDSGTTCTSSAYSFPWLIVFDIP